MFTQLFGNYLLKKAIVTPEQLLSVMNACSQSRIKLGTLCIHAGLMTSAEVEKVYIIQTHQDKLFGEIAIEEGYLTASDVERLLGQQAPDYLLLAQELTEQGILTQEETERILYDYQSETELFDLDMLDEHKDKLKRLVTNFCSSTSISNSDTFVSYLQLLFNNLIRFIGDDFTPLNLIEFEEYAMTLGSSQKINGAYTFATAIDMDEETAIKFASRYAGESFKSFDEFVAASMEDFLNLHNGLYVVNISNTHSLELSLDPPYSLSNEMYESGGVTYLLPIQFTFGTINFLISIIE